MPRQDRLTRRLDELKNRIRQVSREARGSAAKADSWNVNVAGRVNKAVTLNVGQRGSTHGATSAQSVRIVQNGMTTREESITTESSQ